MALSHAGSSLGLLTLAGMGTDGGAVFGFREGSRHARFTPGACQGSLKWILEKGKKFQGQELSTIGTGLMNLFPDSPTVYLNLTNLNPNKLLLFSGIFREATGRSLEEFKKVHEQLKNSQQPRLAFDDVEGARRLGQQLLDFQVFEKVEVAEIGKPTEVLKRTPPPPYFLCPQCQGKLEGSNGCSRCDWQRFPGNPDRWGQAGKCPVCQFSYRWDGQSCSHCGYGAIEQQRIRIVPEI